MSDKQTRTTDEPWPQFSPRELIDWLALKMRPSCKTRDDIARYVAIRDAVAERFGMKVSGT